MTPREILQSPKWLSFRHQILQRDHFRCVHCGLGSLDGTTLHAHHIKELWKYPELGFEPDNVITLCIDCHRGVHNGKVFTYVVRQLDLFECA